MHTIVPGTRLCPQYAYRYRGTIVSGDLAVQKLYSVGRMYNCTLWVQLYYKKYPQSTICSTLCVPIEAYGVINNNMHMILLLLLLLIIIIKMVIIIINHNNKNGHYYYYYYYYY